jgi:hypothetical protein
MQCVVDRNVVMRRMTVLQFVLYTGERFIRLSHYHIQYVKLVELAAFCGRTFVIKFDINGFEQWLIVDMTDE